MKWQYPGEAIPLFKDTDPHWKRPQLAYEGHVDVFNLGQKADLLAYQKIIHLVSARKAFIANEVVHFDEKAGVFKVFVRWAMIFLRTPMLQMPRSNLR